MEALAQDNGEVVESRLLYSGNVLKHENGPEIILDDLDYKYEAQETFLYVGMDQAGNI
ncbi:MAG: hypothetical protein H6765_04040 [Candidatus Peribacteria bacterium]|nr:MAG: hypothetical protein H6765_04040 [Candidatus Peribacteria bacterium]